MKEFNLSKKVQFDTIETYYLEEDVKEFIRLLKEELKKTKGMNHTLIKQIDIGEYDKFVSINRIFRIIDKLAGEKLK